MAQPSMPSTNSVCAADITVWIPDSVASTYAQQSSSKAAVKQQ
jgi:hypothetical protein